MVKKTRARLWPWLAAAGFVGCVAYAASPQDPAELAGAPLQDAHPEASAGFFVGIQDFEDEAAWKDASGERAACGRQVV